MTCKFKQALTYHEQLELMKNRGLIVNNDELAIKVLSRVNYYKLSGYSLHLKDGDFYIKGTKFEDIYDTYLFNKKLSILIIDLLESVEGHFKTSFANVLARKYGADAHVKSELFLNDSHFESFMNLYEREKNNHSKVKFVQHNNEKYGELPIWVAIEILSFGPISKLYKNLVLSDDKKEIADLFLLHDQVTVSPFYLQNWLEVTGTLRNRCAHHSRLYNRSIPVTVKLHKSYISKGIRLSTSEIDRNSIFAALLIIKRMVMKEEQWIDVMRKLNELFENFSHAIEIEKIGFPNNWKEYL